MIYNNINHRKTQKQKNENDFEYYKTILDSLSTSSADNLFTFEDSKKNKMQINYDLYNNKIDLTEFNYICKPFGESDQGELPANMTNHDIISGKIKAVESMEISEPFDYSVIAVNEEATTRKEKEKFERLKQYVIDSVMMPIKLQAEQEMMAQTQGKEKLSPEEIQQLQAQMEEKIKANTPEEVYKYMEREHQDPAEMLAVHLINYLQFKESFKRKTNKGWKHACISGHEIYHIGHDANLQPSLEVKNPLKAIFDKTTECEFYEDLDWFAYEDYMSTTEIIKLLGSDLSDKEIDGLYEKCNNLSLSDIDNENGLHFKHNVLHAVWVSLRKIGFLIYLDSNQEPQETIVTEEYKFDKKNGDINISWLWIPEIHEGYKIGNDMYKRMGPVLGQTLDIDNLYKHKLPYCGATYDNLNSESVSLIDRMKHYQYYYNIIMYRIEMLMASDKGKILMMNINAIPKSAGIDLQKFLYYAEALKIGFYNPKEEGNRDMGNSAGEIAKEVDMSLASDIQKYIALGEYIERRCGESVGINKNIEGLTDPREAVRNAQMNYQQASGILQTYYDLHNIVKKNLLEQLLEKTKTLFALNPSQKKLQYILDDMTLAMFEVDFDLLDNSVYGIFISNSTLDKQAKEAVKQLAHAAMQNDKANLKDISKILRSTSVQEGEELLEKAEREAQERAENLEKMRADALEKDRQEKQIFRREEMEHEKAMIILKEKERRETELQKTAMLSTGFNEDKDMDKDSTPDVLEIYKEGLDAEIKIKKQELDEKKFKHQQEKDAQQISIIKQKMTKNI